MADRQPSKLAAFEGLGGTTEGAPFHIAGYYSDGEVKADRDPQAALGTGQARPRCHREGLDAYPPEDRPPVNIVRIVFQTMVGIGTLLATPSYGKAGAR